MIMKVDKVTAANGVEVILKSLRKQKCQWNSTLKKTPFNPKESRKSEGEVGGPGPGVGTKGEAAEGAGPVVRTSKT